LRPLPDEPYESWCERVRMFEHGHAMMEIARGKDPEQVLEEMARRIMDKLLHPLYKIISENNLTFDTEESKKTYKEKYLDKNPQGVADHVDTNS